MRSELCFYLAYLLLGIVTIFLFLYPTPNHLWYRVVLCSLSNLAFSFYWSFWKELFSFKKNDGFAYHLTQFTIYIFAFTALIVFLVYVFPNFEPYIALINLNIGVIAQFAGVIIFVLTYQKKEKLLSIIMISGAFSANLLAALSQDQQLHDLTMLPQTVPSPFAYFAAFVVETIFFSTVLGLKLRNSLLERRKLEDRLSIVKLEALRSQMNPHFIHNCLSAINRLIVNYEVDAAMHYLTRFSRLIRSFLSQSRESFIPLSQEMYVLEKYLEMESLRFSEQFVYEILVSKEAEALNAQIAPMLIQPFVENAIYHGLLPSKRKCILRISVETEQNQIHIRIADNGIGRETAAERKTISKHLGPSLGIQITQEQFDILSTQYGEGIGFIITDLYDENQNPVGTSVLIHLPIKKPFVG
ncbi:MAG: histidine kinase [Bacteroidota bacterium]